MSRHFSATLIVTDVEIPGRYTFCSGEKTSKRARRAMLREPDAMSCKWPSIEELHVVVAEDAARKFLSRDFSRRATARAGPRERSNNSIDLTEGARYSTPRFWHKRSQVTIVKIETYAARAQFARRFCLPSNSGRQPRHDGGSTGA